MVCLGNEQRSSVIFEIASKYCILYSFVYYDGYSISSEGFLPTVVDIMVFWVNFTLSSSILLHWFLKFVVYSCHLLFDQFQFALIYEPNIPGSYAVLLFTASDFTSNTSPIHIWVLFLLWLRLFILSGVISPLISSSILGTYQRGEFIFQCPIYLFAFSYCSWGSQGKNTEVVCYTLLQWTSFCQNSPPWLHHLWWPYKAWLIVSLS